MPKVILFGKQVRCRPLLDAIGAQEWVEHMAGSRPPATRFTGQATHDRLYDEAVRKRNTTEKRLRPNEHAAWEAWRQCDAHDREVTRYILLRHQRRLGDDAMARPVQPANSH